MRLYFDRAFAMRISTDSIHAPRLDALAQASIALFVAGC